MARGIKEIGTLAAVGAVAYIVLTNWDSIAKIGGKVSGGISSGLTKLSGDKTPSE